MVGVGAVTYTVLSNNRIKDIDFSWDRALNFDGETAPYVQYTHARCCSLLRKAEQVELGEVKWDALCDDEAQALLRLMGRFPDVIQEAAVKYEPSMITRAVTDIAQAYNKFYYEHRKVIRAGRWLVGIEAPERM